LNRNRHEIAKAIDWVGMYEERCAIREHEAGYDRDTAEEWCNLCLSLPSPSLCAGCGESLGAAFLDLPDGARIHWERDTVVACLLAYCFTRNQHAGEELAIVGLQPPTSGRT
jgi:hypothetical protein